jgi:hypothetical protein
VQVLWSRNSTTDIAAIRIGRAPSPYPPRRVSGDYTCPTERWGFFLVQRPIPVETWQGNSASSRSAMNCRHPDTNTPIQREIQAACERRSGYLPLRPLCLRLSRSPTESDFKASSLRPAAGSRGDNFSYIMCLYFRGNAAAIRDKANVRTLKMNPRGYTTRSRCSGGPGGKGPRLR